MKQLNSFISGVLPTNHFARGVSILVAGTVGAQAIMMLAAPILTRLYTPQDFGLLAVYVALLSLVAVIASLRYELAIPLPADDNDAAALLVLCLLAVFAVAAISAVPILLYRNQIAHLLNTPRLADYLYLVPLGTLFSGIYSVLNCWAIRMKAFTSLASTKISQSVVAVGIQLMGASLGPIALLLGQITGNVAGSISLIVSVLQQQWKLVTIVTLYDVSLAAHRYKRFPLFSTWSALFNTTGSQLPPILFAALFSPAAAGIYTLANFVFVPIQLLGQAISNVFFSNAAQAQREGNLRPLVAGIHSRLSHIAMPPILVLLIAGPELFRLLFGPEWREAGVFVQWMAPWLYLVFITSPLSSLLDVFDRQATVMAFQGLLLIVRVAAITAGAWIGDITTAVAFFALGGAACWFAYLVWIIRVSGNRWNEIWRPAQIAFTWAVALVSPLILATIWDIDRTIWLFSFAISFAFIAARYTYLMKDAWR